MSQTQTPIAARSTQAFIRDAFLLLQRGQLEQAEALCRSIVQEEPGHADVLHLLGLIAHQQGNPQAAVDFLTRATKAAPAQPTFHYNLGGIFKELGELDLAASSYRRVLSLTPDPEAFNNLGIVLKAQGKVSDAIDCYKRALALKPDFAEAHNNLGNTFLALRKLEDATVCFRHALAVAPHLQHAHSSLGVVLLAQGRLDEAISSHLQALRLGMVQETKTAFAHCIKHATFTRRDSEMYSLVTLAIQEAWIRPGDLSTPALSLIRLNENLNASIERAKAAWPHYLTEHELFGTPGLKVAADESLLLSLLENAPVISTDIERLLTLTRRILLQLTMEVEHPAQWDSPHIRFFIALAQQCFFNEYIYAIGDDESDMVEALKARVLAKVSNGTKVPELDIVALAAYCPLVRLPCAGSLLALPWSDSVRQMLRQQIQNSLEEAALKSTIPRLTVIGEGVSRAVQELYEENPYPRWTGRPLASTTQTVDTFFQRSFPASPIRPTGLTEGVEILIAGCGTGQHSIQTATSFQNARVLAIDLSMASLGYAKRKSAELGLTNIEYAQADIMQLGRLERSFDIVESVGVLHHMADPVAGWRLLVGLLRPGGLMRLGFYSELARSTVVAAREYISANNYGSSARDIRQCRQDLMTTANNSRFEQLQRCGDFYDMSGCRDLLFHVQEHRFTVPQLKALIEDLQLVFVGFSLDATVTQSYLSRFPSDPSMTSLDNWHLFEIDNPDTFANMYQFWVQRGAKPT